MSCISLCERIVVVNNIHSKFYVVYFNASNTKITHMLDFLDTSSMGVTSSL
jgi:hypothetical protein